jgi:hypothetical protein
MIDVGYFCFCYYSKSSNGADEAEAEDLKDLLSIVIMIPHGANI